MSETRKGLPVLSFEDPAAFEAWLAARGPSSHGLWLWRFRKGCGIAGLSKAEAIDAALCHGWIDGQLDKYDERSWLVRFTPRKNRSKWSDIWQGRDEARVSLFPSANAQLANCTKSQRLP